MKKVPSTPEEALRLNEETEGPSPRKSTIIGGSIKAPDLGGRRLGPATDPRAGKQKG